MEGNGDKGAWEEEISNKGKKGKEEEEKEERKGEKGVGEGRRGRVIAMNISEQKSCDVERLGPTDACSTS